MDPVTMLAALGPLAVDVGKTALQKKSKQQEFVPDSVDDFVKMKQVELEMFKAMNEAGLKDTGHPVIDAIVRLMRPAVACAVIGTWAYMELNGTSTAATTDFAAAVGFYLFGDRTLFYSKKTLDNKTTT